MFVCVCVFELFVILLFEFVSVCLCLFVFVSVFECVFVCFHLRVCIRVRLFFVGISAFFWL